MNFLNLDLSKTYDSPQFTGSDPIARATWFCLLAYSARQENGGRIRNCNAWGERRWPQECKVFRPEVDSTADPTAGGLLSWDGEDLLVFGYPAYQEASLNAKRAGGKAGGKAFADRMKEKAQGQERPVPQTLPGHSPGHSPDDSPDGKVKVKGKVKVIPEENGATSSFKKIQISDYGTIHDPIHDPIDLASSITGDDSPMGRGGWKKDLAVLGDERFRSVLDTVWGEKKTGDHALNWAAILTSRLKKVRIALSTPTAKT